ncbi:MAG: polynucleotide adenylyltransferase PcnB [Proteobacteria bacterium]|nr:polynucleotide adenylyltransferase PcnB [Pseudomonadota bacterium]
MSSASTTINAKVLPVAEHRINKRRVDRFAVEIIRTLSEAGYHGYIVGGGVRDLLLGMKPKDFDIATDATPEQIHQLFRRSRIIGRRFRLVHVYTRGELIEVATFRGPASAKENKTCQNSGRILSDNTYGSMAEDAIRRDFTINALFYDPLAEEIYDFVGGYEDLNKRLLRVIGDPELRYREDPVRVLRAARFTAKLGVKADAASERPIYKAGQLLADVPPARLFDEVLKLLLSSHAVASFAVMQNWGLVHQLFPQLKFDKTKRVQEGPLLQQAMLNTEERIHQGKPVTPAFLFAALLWEPMNERARKYEDKGYSAQDALTIAGDEIIARQCRVTAIPRRFSAVTRGIWAMQPRFEKTRGSRAWRLLNERKFRAAYDFLILRSLEDEALLPLVDWWTQIQTISHAEQEKEIFVSGKGSKRRRPRKRKPASGQDAH